MIAEIAQAHDGSLGILHSYIDSLSKIGVNAVKFQMHIAEAESSAYEPFRVNFSYEDTSRFDYWNRTGFTFKQWQNIKSHCEEVGLEFICSPFSNMAVDWLEELKVNYYKIGSGEVNNFLLLSKVASTGKKVILSSGMSSFDELDKSVAFLKNRNVDFSILQCTTAYPTTPENYGLNVIQDLKSRYNVSVGFSDHSADPATCIAATALGADILEFHVVFHKEMFGPDSAASLSIGEVEGLVGSVRNISKAIHHPVDKKDNSKFETLKNIFEKSLAVNKDLKAGDIIGFDDLESKKPKGYGIPARKFEEVIGKTLNKDLSKWDFLTSEDLI
jgi:N-acetylneuraminate synthase